MLQISIEKLRNYRDLETMTKIMEQKEKAQKEKSDKETKITGKGKRKKK